MKYKFEDTLDSPERTLAHRTIIKEKPFLRQLYMDWYGVFSQEMRTLPEGLSIELGSGGGFLKELEPSVICTDILPLPSNDLTFSALDMPFQASEVSGIFMIDTFHHIPDSEQFLNEANRVLKPGGKIVMVEPANSLWGRFIYQNLHHEPFIPSGGWTIPSTGPMSGANGALPWIVFERDKNLFNRRFADLSIQSIKYHTPLRYLLSGGVSYQSFVPDSTFKFFSKTDEYLARLSKQLSMFMTITVRKAP